MPSQPALVFSILFFCVAAPNKVFTVGRSELCSVFIYLSISFYFDIIIRNNLMIIELLLDVVISRATSYLSSILFGDGVTLYTQCWGRVCV